MKRVCAVVVALLLFTPVLSQAAPLLPGAPETVPLLYACVNDQCMNLTDFIRPVNIGIGDAGVGATKVVYDINTPEIQFAAGLVELSGLMNPDPFITFGATTTNLIPGPVTYAFLFGTPIVPGFYSGASSSAGVTVTSGAATATVDNSVIPPGTYVSGYGTVGAVPSSLGVDLGTVACIDPAGVGTTTCNQGVATSSFGPTFYDNLEALLSYTQDDVLSVASWSGEVRLDPSVRIAPEPTLLLLGGTALAGFAVRRRRR
jgi:hypothetical protein